MMDHGRFAYSAIVDRPPLTWPNGARVALWVINVEHRIRYLDEALSYVTSHDHVWRATGSEIIDAFKEATNG